MNDRKELGREFAPDVECQLSEIEGLFCGNISIGDFYYEADTSKESFKPIKEELIGCLESIKEQIDVELIKLEGK